LRKASVVLLQLLELKESSEITDPPLDTLTLDLRMVCPAGILLIEISSYPSSFPDVGM